MPSHKHTCYYCQFPVEDACDCDQPRRAVVCENCQMIYEPMSEGDNDSDAIHSS